MAFLAIALLLPAGCNDKKAALSPTGEKLRPKEVRIIVRDDSSGQFRISVEPEDLTISMRRREIVRWCVDYNGTAEHTLVSVTGFVNQADSTIKEPFGTASIDNVFDIANFDFKCRKLSKQPSKMGTFKYTVVFKVKGEVRKTYDPRIIIST
jgi:hypothetical protein